MSNISARLDRLPISSFHYKLLAIIAIGMFFDAFDVFILSGIVAVLVKSGFSTKMQVATLISVNFAGLFLGALVSGFLNDRYGRRTMFVWNMLIYAIASILCALTPNYTFLLVFRFLAAFGLGGEIATGWTVLGEFVPPTKRGTWGSLLYLIINCAMPIALFLGAFVLPMGAMGWRILFLLAGIPAVLAFFVRRTMPESPRWIEVMGRHEEADKIVSQIEAGIEQQTGKKLPPATASSPQVKLPVSVLFHKVLLKTTILAILLWVVMQLISYCFVMWLPHVFVEKGVGIAKSMTLIAVILIGNPVGGIVGMIIGDRISRKWAIVVMTVIGAVLSYVYALSTTDTRVLVVGFFFATTVGALNSVSWSTYIPEQFPTSVRGGINGIASSLGRLANVGAPYVVLAIMTAYGFSGVMITFSALFLLLGLLTAIMGAETKGKSLEEINERVMKGFSA